MKFKFFTLIAAYLTLSLGVFANSFTGFMVTSDHKLGEQILNENLIQNMVNMTLVETNTTKHQFSINLIEAGTGSFTMGEVQFLYTFEEAGKTGYKTYDNYIQPNGVDREIRIPAVRGEKVNVMLMEACDSILVDGDLVNMVAGDNVLTAKGNGMVLRNVSKKPKISAIVPKEEKANPSMFWKFDEGGLASMEDTIRSTVTVDGLTLYAGSGLSYMVYQTRNAHIDGETFHRALKTHGHGYNDHYLVSFPVEGPCKIEVFYESASSEDERTLRVDVGSFGSKLAEIPAPLDPVKGTVYYEGTEASTIYLYGLENGIVIYGIRVTLGGKSGHIEWTIDKEEKLMNCTGEAEMLSFDSTTNRAPWYIYRSLINEVHLAEGIKTIGKCAFYGCENLENIFIPSSVREIEKFAFDGTKIAVDPHNMYNGTFYVQDWLIKTPKDFMGSCTVKDNTVGIANDAFYHCEQLVSVELPQTLLYLGDYCFADCPLLTSVELPKGVLRIGTRAFNSNNALSSLTCLAVTPPALATNAFDGVNQSACTLYVPEESVEVYKNTNVWKDFYAIVGVATHEGVQSVEEHVQPASKILRGNQVFILRAGKIYTITGQEVR